MIKKSLGLSKNMENKEAVYVSSQSFIFDSADHDPNLFEMNKSINMCGDGYTTLQESDLDDAIR